MVMLSIVLSDEEKFEVLFVAFSLFLVASCISICIAAASCPLNKWLQERDSNKRRQTNNGQLPRRPSAMFQQSPTLVITGGPKRHTSGSMSFSGPPPAYEVALSAARVQSVLSSPIIHSQSQTNSTNGVKDAHIDFVPQLPQEKSNSCEKELDLGDYFHPPKEQLISGGPFGEPSLEQVFVPMDAVSADALQQVNNQNQPQESVRAIAARCNSTPPIMLRLWARLIEPVDLMDLAREDLLSRREFAREESHGGGALAGVATTIGDHWGHAEAGIRRLSTQLSIPQLFGSLIAIGSPKSSNILNETADETCIDVEQTDDSNNTVQAADQSFNSMSSTATSTGEFDQVEQAEAPAKKSNTVKPERTIMNAMSEAMSTPSGKRLLSQVESVTSRVLHMNVASFSYVKDEKLVSSKKHCQLNLKHFFETSSELSSSSSMNQEQSLTKDQTSGANRDADSKLCQLMISICDIENLLNACWLNEKACVLLSQYSSVYVRCDIIGSKTKYPVGLLRNPLRVLQQAAKIDSRRDSEDVNKHTINFGEAISASAVEQPAMLPVANKVELSSGNNNRQPIILSPTTSSSTDSSLTTTSSLGNRQSGSPATTTSSASEQNENSRPSTGKAAASITFDAKSNNTNWRHDPSADGKAIVTFNSVPKLIADMHQFAAAARVRSQQVDSRQQQVQDVRSTTVGYQSTDLIQFDSVFISPILSRSLIENSYLRLRIYSQSKYINDTCLAELKLPLRQLTRSPTEDNLYDVECRTGEPNLAQDSGFDMGQTISDKSKFILNNLVANLVTAETGAPLASLIEQVSEERASVIAQDSAGSHANETGEDEAKQTDIGSTLRGALFGSTKSAFACGPKSCSAGLSSLAEEEKDQRHLARAGNSLGTALDRLNEISDPQGYDRKDELMYYCQTNCQRDDQIERLAQNRMRSLHVSHWLDYLSAPAYECESIEEVTGELVMGLTYLPTSNRLIMHALRATLDSSDAGRRLAKKLRLSANATYQLRLLMVANGRVLKRKQTTSARRLEWDSQEPITFDLAQSNVEQPAFIIALVVRNGPIGQQQVAASARGFGCGLANCTNCIRLQQENATQSSTGAQSTMTGAIYGERAESDLLRRFGTASTGRLARNNLVAGHVVLGDDIWRELRSQPRKQIVKRLKMS